MILIEMLPNLYLGDLESVKYKAQIDASHTINCVKDLKTVGNNSEYVFNKTKLNVDGYCAVYDSINFKVLATKKLDIKC